MTKMMSLSARRELLASVRQTYHDAGWADKGKILDGFIAATGYGRKHAIQLLNSPAAPVQPMRRLACRKYDEQVRQALFSCGIPPTKFAPSASYRFCRRLSMPWNAMAIYVCQ